MPGTKGLSARDRRKLRIRRKITGNAERPRLAVYRSERHVYAQLIDDDKGLTLAAASTVEKGQRGEKGNNTVVGAKRIGALLAERAKTKGIAQVVFDRSGYKYHGRIKSLADAARENGLKF